jgi:3-oxocholest-4-en-26-oyl-CoA dehydrogenase beta subunit
MDFTFSEEQEAVAQAAAGLFDGMVDSDRVVKVESTDDRIDEELWQALAAADLLGLAVPESLGGGGLGLTELCLVLEAQGRVVAPVPLWATLVLGAFTLARFGTESQGQAWLPEVARGTTMLSAAVTGSAQSVLGRPPVVATADGSSYELHGVEYAVPSGHVAARIIVPACTDDGGVLLALVNPSAAGVTVERAETTNREICAHLHLDGVRIEAEDVVAHPGVGPKDGPAALEFLLEAAMTGLCALQVGVCESALAQTATYLNQREQFERPLSTFQATMLRAADAAIDIEAMRVTLWQAAWRLDTGRESASAVATAKWQSSERGQRVVHATQHLHGGMGADITYPIHRYFLWGKQIELLLGGPSRQLLRLGRLLTDRVDAALAREGGLDR